MTIVNQSVQLNPAVKDSLAGTLQFCLNKFLENIDGMLPARVVAYDRVNSPNRIKVQPLIFILNTDGSTESRPQPAEIPVFSFGGGNFFISFNLRPGDFGWIKSNDRDISLFLQSYTESKPNTLRKMSFSDAVFIPDVMRGYTINPEDLNSMVISSIDGTVKITLATDVIQITAPLVIVNGNVQVNGNIAATGTITPGG